jgi:hypothetical protein
MNPKAMVNRPAAAVCLAVLLSLAPASRGGQIVFVNGDRISGTPGQIDAGGHLLWTPDGSSNAVRLPLETIDQIETGTSGGQNTGRNISLTLSNNDLLHGSLRALGEETVEVESPAFGTISVPRPMIADLSVSEGGYFLLPHPGNSKDWFVDRTGSWKVLNGVLRSTEYGVLGRGLPRASRIRVDFEVSGSDNNLGFTVHLFSTNEKVPARGSHYALQFAGSYVYVRKVSRTEEAGGLFGRAGGINHEQMGDTVRLEKRLGSRPVRMTILGDAKSGTIILLVDGKELQRWSDPRGFGEKHGTAIGFGNNNSQELEIRNLSVSRWNGANPGEENQPAVDLDADMVYTANDDYLSGLVTGVKNGDLAIDSEHFGPLLVPTQRIQRVQLATLTREQARRREGDVRVTLHDGSILTLQLLALDGESLTGTSENTGEVKIAASEIAKIKFNLYRDSPVDPASVSIGDSTRLLGGDW